MSSKKKERTLIFSMAMGANYTFELISIKTCVIILRQCVGLKQLRIPNSLPYVHSFFRRQNGIWVKFQHFWPKNDGPKLIVLIELQSQAMKYDFFGLGEARAISDILQSCFTYPKPQPAFYSCTISSYYIYIIYIYIFKRRRRCTTPGSAAAAVAVELRRRHAKRIASRLQVVASVKCYILLLNMRGPTGGRRRRWLCRSHSDTVRLCICSLKAELSN